MLSAHLYIIAHGVKAVPVDTCGCCKVQASEICSPSTDLASCEFLPLAGNLTRGQNLGGLISGDNATAAGRHPDPSGKKGVLPGATEWAQDLVDSHADNGLTADLGIECVSGPGQLGLSLAAGPSGWPPARRRSRTGRSPGTGRPRSSSASSRTARAPVGQRSTQAWHRVHRSSAKSTL